MRHRPRRMVVTALVAVVHSVVDLRLTRRRSWDVLGATGYEDHHSP